MKRILHAVAALWPSKTEDRSWKTEDRLKTEKNRSRETEGRWEAEERRREHEGPWLPEARNGLLQHLTAMMRMGETVRELATRECTHVPSHKSSKEQPSESAHLQTNESAPKKTDNQLPKRMIVSEQEQPAERIGEPLPIAQVLARIYLRHAPRCAMGEADEKVVPAEQLGSASSDSAKPNSQPLSLVPERPVPLASWVLALFMCLLSAQQVSAQAEPAAAAVKPDAIIEKDLERFPLVKYDPDFSQVEGLVIGDSIPGYLWDLPLWVVNHPDGRDTMTLRDYESSKLLVLDFWARWCAPCVASMDKWEGYVRELAGDAVLVGVHIDFDYKALPFATQKGWQSPSVIGEGAYLVNRHFFDQNAVSRMAWIREGKLIAITSGRGYDLEAVTDVAEGRPVDIPMDYNWTYQSGNSSNP